MSNQYCGIHDVPKGKVRGSAQHCLKCNQARYYGIEEIDPMLLKKITLAKKYNLNAERIKLRNIRSNGEALLKEIKRMRIIMDNENVTDSEYKKAKKRLVTLQGRKDKILQQFKAQEAVIANIVAQQDEIMRNEQRSKSKSKRKK